MENGRLYKTRNRTSCKRDSLKKPISKIKISEITDACGVNRQTFYYHFDDIYDLLKYLFTTEALKYYASEGINPNSIEPKDITLAIFHFMRNNRTLILNSYDSDHRVQYSEMIKALISLSLQIELKHTQKIKISQKIRRPLLSTSSTMYSPVSSSVGSMMAFLMTALFIWTTTSMLWTALLRC